METKVYIQNHPSSNSPTTPPPPTPMYFNKIDKNKWNSMEMNRNYGLHNHLLSEETLSRKYNIQEKHVFSNRISNKGSVTHQKSSGRCWLFAALNMIRSSGFLKKYNLPSNFEFSQNYLFFWDKFERVNYLLEMFEKTKDEPLEGRLMSCVLKEPIGDGGQWQMFVNLIEKYGIVPKDVYPESFHSSNTAGLNMVLSKKIREYCKQIRFDSSSENKKHILKEVFGILVQFLGKPPSSFNWIYYDKSDKYCSIYDITPLQFYKKYVNIDVRKYVSLINDPRNDYNRLYTVRYLNNVIESPNILHLNMNMDVITRCMKKSIDMDEPIWFGCDVGQFMRSQNCILDKDLFDIEGRLNIKFGMNKRERIEYGDSLMTHAMLITGYNVNEEGKIDRWQIENSWGTKGDSKGYYSMSHKWMKEFLYQISVPKQLLTEEEKKYIENKDIITLELWDPMGALATVY